MKHLRQIQVLVGYEDTGEVAQVKRLQPFVNACELSKIRLVRINKQQLSKNRKNKSKLKQNPTKNNIFLN
jgi:hypothetical protein